MSTIHSAVVETKHLRVAFVILPQEQENHNIEKEKEIFHYFLCSLLSLFLPFPPFKGLLQNGD